jgi:hypothetical protein
MSDNEQLSAGSGSDGMGGYNTRAAANELRKQTLRAPTRMATAAKPAPQMTAGSSSDLLRADSKDKTAIQDGAKAVKREIETPMGNVPESKPRPLGEPLSFTWLEDELIAHVEAVEGPLGETIDEKVNAALGGVAADARGRSAWAKAGLPDPPPEEWARKAISFVRAAMPQAEAAANGQTTAAEQVYDLPWFKALCSPFTARQRMAIRTYFNRCVRVQEGQTAPLPPAHPPQLMVGKVDSLVIKYNVIINAGQPKYGADATSGRRPVTPYSYHKWFKGLVPKLPELVHLADFKPFLAGITTDAVYERLIKYPGTVTYDVGLMLGKVVAQDATYGAMVLDLADDLSRATWPHKLHEVMKDFESSCASRMDMLELYWGATQVCLVAPVTPETRATLTQCESAETFQQKMAEKFPPRSPTEPKARMATKGGAAKRGLGYKPKPTDWSESRTCHRCHHPGHLMKDCPQTMGGGRGGGARAPAGARPELCGMELAMKGIVPSDTIYPEDSDTDGAALSRRQDQ